MDGGAALRDTRRRALGRDDAGPGGADAEAPYAGLRVVETGGGLAVSYAGKLFADAGADVVKLEPPRGEALRRRSASGARPADDAPGALFRFLNAGKRSSVGALGQLPADEFLAAADVVLVAAPTGADRVAVQELHRRFPEAVTVAVTPYGLTGPYTEDACAVNEFVLQAQCGSTAGRGLPADTPMQAGGNIGEWIAGSYAAAAAAAMNRGREATGRGALVDLSVLEAMVVTMGGLSAVAADVLGDAAPTSGRGVELPSIATTADGLVGFCTITAQQFQDFLVMIERPDLLADAELATAAGRLRRREEFVSAVDAWTGARTTDEILELAAALRIPAAPVGTPATVTGIDHFAARGVFTDNPAGFRQPRVPYAIGAFRGVPLSDAPASVDTTVAWHPRSAPRPPREPAGDPQLPLSGLRILDLTAFWAGPFATMLLGALGADVVKLEGVRRPDGMRFAGAKPPSHEGWWETGSTFLSANAAKRGLTLDLGHAQARQLALRLVAECDVVMENFSPRVLPNLGLAPDTLRAANPHAVLVRMPAFGLDGPWRDRVGFAQTMEQASGMAWMTGGADGLPLIPRGACDPIAGLHAVFATLAALELRDRTGEGTLVESTMVEAVLNVAAEAVVEYTAYGAILMRDGNRAPDAAPQGVYRCHGSDAWIALSITEDGHWPVLCEVIGRSDLGSDTRLRHRSGRRAAHDRIDAAITAWTAQRDPVKAVEELRTAGLAAAVVSGGAALFDHPQLSHRGFFERVGHPVVGQHRIPGLPFQLAGRPRAWITRPAPTMGEHNHEILAGLLGLSDDELDALRDEGVIGTRPAGL